MKRASADAIIHIIYLLLTDEPYIDGHLIDQILLAALLHLACEQWHAES